MNRKKSRTGYSIGIGYPPDWGEHTLNIQKGDKTILKMFASHDCSYAVW